MSESIPQIAPDPLVPQHVDLRGLPFMPLAVNRLRDSDLAVKASGDAFRAAVLLWCASWNQVPAASLPDDDELLAAYAGYARDVKGWKKIRVAALRNFVLCADGRLYHPVVAAYAMEAWEEREDYRDERANTDERKKRERVWRKAAFKALRVAGVVPHWNEKTAVLRDLVKEHGVTVTTPDTELVTPPVTVTGHAHVTAKKGQGSDSEGTGITQEQDKSSLRSDSSSAAPTTSSGDAQRSEADKQRKQELKAARVAGITADAMQVFNGLLAKPHGLLTKVSDVNLAKKRRWVERCIPVASDICLRQYGNKLVTLQFWQDYFGACDMDDFMAGRSRNGAGHENWKPDFEYLTRPDVMTKVFERITSEGGEGA